MNSLKEFIISFFESAKDRLKNPMIGAFVIAWFALNWRTIAVLFFSDKIIEDRIAFIELNYLNWNLSLWIPIYVAVFYVLILPYIMALFDWLSQRGVSVRKLILKTHRISDIQHRQEIAAEEWQLEKIREGSPDIQAMKDKISKLEIQLEEKDEVIANLSENIETESEDTQKEKTESTTPQKTKRKSNSKTKTKESKKEEPKKDEITHPELKKYPIMKDIVIRDLAKTEREWILIYSLYSSDFGKNVITRDDIWNKYEESNRVTHSRRTNLTNNIKNMVKSGQLKFINDDEMLLTESGVQTATEILNR